MTPCLFLFGASSHPYIPLHFEEMIFPLVIKDNSQKLVRGVITKYPSRMMNDGKVSDDLKSRGNLFQCEQVFGTNEKRYEFVREKGCRIDSCMFTEKRLFVKSPDGFPPTCVYDFIHSTKLDILSTHGERREIAES